MPTNISFMMTPDQIRTKQKTVTRRDRWLKLMPGRLLRPVEKCMGLKLGEKMVRLLPDDEFVRVTDVRREPLEAITQSDVIAEGFPKMTPAEFVAMYRKHSPKASTVTRIEFEYTVPKMPLRQLRDALTRSMVNPDQFVTHIDYIDEDGKRTSRAISPMRYVQKMQTVLAFCCVAGAPRQFHLSRILTARTGLACDVLCEAGD